MFSGNRAHLDLHGLTHLFPTRRSSDLPAMAPCAASLPSLVDEPPRGSPLPPTYSGTPPYRMNPHRSSTSPPPSTWTSSRSNCAWPSYTVTSTPPTDRKSTRLNSSH